MNFHPAKSTQYFSAKNIRLLSYRLSDKSLNAMLTVSNKGPAALHHIVRQCIFRHVRPETTNIALIFTI